ncbi:retinol dehydrogenase 11 isoform X1 [Diabrotica virgifera virgifera]|uniref:Retinol dehydrogenase 12-like n=1 Tax=Diabrotica virgifera virgifera TaxID=50390 RepID=A0ABM5KWM2_DIAVI|nr:retinol dehydrogenase 11 isoform X1 [Diabrotica virgifera virgifera]
MGMLFSVSCNSNNRLNGKTALITGANSGIGKTTAKDFYIRGARVILACRDIEKAKTTICTIQQQCESKENLGELEAVELDLSSLQSVRECAKAILEKEKQINILINNAGVMMCPFSRTEDGYETQFATNHLGHFLLTLLLLPRIIKSAPARIINVSSSAHSFTPIDFSDINWEKRTYSPMGAYSQSKLSNILFTKELATRLKENNIQGVNIYSLHPGVIRTNLGRHVSKKIYFPGLHWLWRNVAPYIIKNPEQGAQTQIYCAVDEKCANETGLYYSNCKVIEPSADAKNEQFAKQLWEISLNMVGLDENFNPFKT